jgi:DNA-binding beta-propeller fold protein YncE
MQDNNFKSYLLEMMEIIIYIHFSEVIYRRSHMKIWYLLMIFTLCPAQISLQELGRFGGNGTAAGLFKNPSGIDISEDGRLFICDRGNHRIQVFDLKGNFMQDLGGFGWKNEQFDEPMDIWARSTINIFIADYNNGRVQRFNRNLNYINSLTSNSADNDSYQFKEVLSAAYSPQGDIFILDAGENKIIKFNSKSKGEIAFGYYISGRGELTSPVQIDLTVNYQVLVSDAGRNGVFIYDYFGNFLNYITSKDIKQASGLAVDDKNRIYLADKEGAAIYIFTITGKLLKKIDTIGAQPLNKPQDIALYRIKPDGYTLYLIDADFIKIAALTYVQ